MQVTRNGVTVSIDDNEVIRLALARVNGESLKVETSAALLPEIGLEVGGERFAGIVRGPGGRTYKLWDRGWSDEAMPHAAAVEYAQTRGGVLANRHDGRILHGNLDLGAKDLPGGYFWLEEQCEGCDVCAWLQNFAGGTQYSALKGNVYRARAVRREPI